MSVFSVIKAKGDFGSGDCNIPLFKQELKTAFSAGGYKLESVLEHASGYVIITPDYGSVINATIGGIIGTTAAAHDHELVTTAQLIADQQVIAREAAKTNLYDYRDQTPVAMYAIVIAQRLRNLQSDSDEIESQAQAVAYFLARMVEHATLIDGGSTTEAGTLMKNAFQALFLTMVEASEYASNGGEDTE